MDDEPKHTTGLQCPDCKRYRTLKQVYTRHSGSYTRRSRRCSHCGRAVVTVEKIIPAGNKVTDA